MTENLLSSLLPGVNYRELMAVTTEVRCDFVNGVADRPVGSTPVPREQPH